MIEVTSKDIDTTVEDVEQDTSFIEPSKRETTYYQSKNYRDWISNLEQ